MTESITGWGRDRGPTDKRWRLTHIPDGFILTVGNRRMEFTGANLARLSTHHGWFRYSLQVKDMEPKRLRGLRRQDALALDAALTLEIARYRTRPAVAAALAWEQRAWALVDTAISEGRWISREMREDLERARPSGEAITTLTTSLKRQLLAWLTAAERSAVAFLATDLPEWIDDHNETIVASERDLQAAFFDQVESRPLTDEQIRAVVSFDNRVHVIASAGSGKTSVMVARAAYALMRGFIEPHRILLLAFNHDAAAELQNRITARLEALGIASEGIRATTFHAFGLQVIGQKTGRKPRPAPWLQDGQDLDMVCRIVDELRDRSAEFAYRWDAFRLLYGRALKAPDGGEPDGYDRENRRTGFRTVNGEVVKSEGERILADWLFFNGVEYRYEYPYVVDVADREHSQYRPDFFYPKIDVWHEHWALGPDGKPPESFEGYTRSMEWKKQLHQTHGTTLIETTWAEIIDYSGLTRLGETLKGLGTELDWNPDRPCPGSKPLKHEDLARLVRTFMTHVKSNSLTPERLTERVAERSTPAALARNRMFIDLYWPIHEQWETRLRAEDCVDFEDMLVEAAGHLEQGDVARDHDLVMVDEFQDASQARARMTRALVSERGKYLLAVGDDWQSINRFAGADISVMTNFEEWFGPGPTLRLQTTFRCPQTICDIATDFVTKNPRQLKKSVVAMPCPFVASVKVVLIDNKAEVPKAIEEYLARIASSIARLDMANYHDRRVSVHVLGRYGFDGDLMPRRSPRDLNVKFRTVHSAKGLETDFVIIPNMSRGVYGFPSNIIDDPVLDLAMTDPDTYPHAEERRLFYVALTRARREVTIFAVAGQESPFVIELMKDGSVLVEQDEDVTAAEICPSCSSGTLVLRNGRYGSFLGCSTFPKCRHTQNAA